MFAFCLPVPAQALDELLRLVQTNAYGLAWLDWKQVLHVLKHFHLYEHALPLYRALQAQFDARIEAWKEEEARARDEAQADGGNAAPAEEQAAASPLPPELCMPFKCLNMLLECVAKSTPAPAAAADAAASAGDGDAAAVSAPDAGLVTTAEDLLAELAAPEQAEKFQWGTSTPWTILLDNLTRGLSPDSPGLAASLARARAFYDSIELRSPTDHNTMLAAYLRTGMSDEAQKLAHALRTDPTAKFGSGIVASHLSLLHTQLVQSLERRGELERRAQESHMTQVVLTDAEHALVAECERVWENAKLRPERLSAVIVGALLKIHGTVGDVDRQVQLVAEAIELESVAQKNSQEGEEKGQEENAASAPVLVDSASACLVLNSLATSANPSEHAATAHAIYAGAVRRYIAVAEGPESAGDDSGQTHAASLLVGSLSARSLGLFVAESAHNAYFKFLQRAGEADQMLEVWPSIPASEKEGNPRLFVAMLNALAGGRPHDGAQQAAALVEEMEGLNVPWDVQLANAWLGCFTRRGEWQQAEAVWARMHPLSGDMRLAAGPGAASYLELMRTYMANAQPEQVAKIAALDAEMRSGQGPAGRKLVFQARDFKRLIQTAHRSRLPDQARFWSERARAAGVWEQMGNNCHTIIERIAIWENQPRFDVAAVAAVEASV